METDIISAIQFMMKMITTTALGNLSTWVGAAARINEYSFTIQLERYTSKYKMETLELIQSLPPELREKIYKEYIKIKLSQRKALGWDKAHAVITAAPFCERNQQIVKILFCHKCDSCIRNGICKLCSRKGDRHYPGFPIYDKNDYIEVFKNSFELSWCDRE